MSSQGSLGSGGRKQLLLCRCDIPHGDEVYVARGLSIGRAPDNTFVVDDAGVARHHCQVELDASGGLVLRCVDPGAEVVHQGQHVGQLALAAGLRFRVGPAEFGAGPPWPLRVLGRTGRPTAPSAILSPCRPRSPMYNLALAAAAK